MSSANAVRKSPKEDNMHGLLHVIKTSLTQSEMAGIIVTLKTIVETFSAFGCVLWEATPSNQPSSQAQVGEFFALAQWFPDDIIWDQYDVPPKSLTGYAIEHNEEWCLTDDLFNDPRGHNPDFLKERKLNRMCTAPVRFLDGARGALNIFRKSDEPPFTNADGLMLHQIADFLPDLYGAIRDKMAYRLSQSVNLKLQQVRPDTTTLEDDLREAIGELCELIGRNLHCYDVSIFLEDPDRANSEFHLYGTTLPDVPGVRTVTISLADSDPTAYPLRSRETIRVFDLRRKPYATQGLQLGAELSEADAEYIKHISDQSCKISTHKTSLSFMSAPVLAGDRLLGIVRCCAPLKGPTYFAEREAKLLRLLAGQIGQFVSDQRNRWQLKREVEAKQILLDGVSSIMKGVDAEWKSERLREDAIIQRSLSTIKSVIDPSDFVGIRQFDPRTGGYRRLRFQPSGISFEAPTRIPPELDKAIHSGEPKLINRLSLAQDEYSALRESLPFAADQMVLAPVWYHEQFGFLEIVHRGPKDLPKDLTPIAGLLGRLIGLYDELLRNIALLDRTQKQEQQAFMDLEHQIRAPLRQSAHRWPTVIQFAKKLDTSGAPRLLKEIEYLQGIHRRAQRVAGNLRLFTNLAAGKPAEVELRSYNLAAIRGTLIAAAMDHQHYWECAGQPRGFDVHRSVLDSHALEQVRLDKRLLEQALDDLLDNASKYSFDGERVRIEANMTKANFIVTIINRGLRIDRSQLAVIVKRGERGALASNVVGEGSGIGLWIVDEIMKAHNGKLEIHPTDSENFTQIRMMFPLEQRK